MIRGTNPYCTCRSGRLLPIREIPHWAVPVEPSGTIVADAGYDSNQLKESIMDKDRIEGTAHQVKGAIKEKIGKITGDDKTRVEGAVEKAAGKVQNTAGRVKDTIRDAVKE
jgi:uncharacterized protein YjbJ (UPF0337 family)